MSNYNFDFLSSWDFEQLTLDLLQAKYGIILETFTTGRDGGIDFRYSHDDNSSVIVQCKHYSGSNFSNLKSTIKNYELKKIKRLNPHRYILVTSLGLTPQNKKDIFSLLEGYCKFEEDIIHKDDLNNYLGLYPEIEKKNFKLWLTSTPVLERILHSSIYNQTEFEKEHIERKLKYYVQNNSYFEAVELLNKCNYCIISGIPGIGKTTLAEVLLIHYQELGYEPIKITSNIEEAHKINIQDKEIIFYYDDFLGQTAIAEKFSKNEESSLLRFIEIISKGNKAKIILTTREYILNQAKAIYEKLSRSDFDINKCIITLNSYTAFDKAKILFNHLYFCNIPKEYLEEVVKERYYMSIINHVNYNPRIIEWMTDLIHIKDVPKDEYFKEFMNNLDYPSKIWDHAFNQQISKSSRALLVVLFSMPREVLLEDLEKAYDCYVETCSKKYGIVFQQSSLESSIKEIEGNFVLTSLIGNSHIISFHNASIKDYIGSFLSENLKILRDLILSIKYFEQCKSILPVYIDNKHLADAIKQLSKEFYEALIRTFNSDECRLMNIVTVNKREKKKWKPSLIGRMTYILNIRKYISCNQSELKEISDSIFQNIIIEDKNRLLEFHLDLDINSWNDEYMPITKEYFVNTINGISDIYLLGRMYEKYPTSLSSTDLEYIKYRFSELYEDEMDWLMSASDIDYLEQYKTELSGIKSYLQIDILNSIDDINNKISEIENYGTNNKDVLSSKLPLKTYSAQDIHSLFDTLLH